MRTTDRVVLALFTASGASGLIYQVIWVRSFGNVFGNSIHSAAVVTAVFMLGLGVGSLVAGRWADRQVEVAAPLRMYGWAEVAIALWGGALAVLLPSLTAVGGAVASYSRSPEGWNVLATSTVALRGAAAVALLFPATFAMGATLTLLVRFVVLDHLEEAGWRIGLLFGLNTVGAAVGALSTDLALVPGLGASGTQFVAVALNLFAAFGAMRLANAAGERSAAPSSAEPSSVDGERLGLIGASVGLALAGFAGMGFEILWFRLASGVLHEHRVVFSMMLAVILIGIAVGSLIGGALERRVGRASALYVVGQALFGVTALVGLLGVDKHAIVGGFYEVRHVPLDSFAGLVRGSWWPSLRPILGLCFAPAFAMGLSFPLANAAVQRVAGRIGVRAGILYLANTVGAVTGSIVVGVALLPSVGIHGTAQYLFFVIVAAAAAFAAAFARRASTGHRAALAAGVVVALVPALIWRGESPDLLWRQQFLQLRDERVEVVARSEGTYQSIVVTETPDGSRWLLTNGYSMSATNPSAQRYMRAFAHVPLLQVEDPKAALVICFGVGNTADAASLHPVELDVVDLSPEVLAFGGYFDATNHGVLGRSNVDVFVNDGRNHLAATPEGTYDLITMEPPPLRQAGVASLYSEDFYALARSRLRSGGFVTQWLPAYQVSRTLQRSIIAAFIGVFEDAVLLVGADQELILVGRRDAPNHFDPQLAQRLLEGRPAVLRDLASIQIDGVVDIVTMFAAGPELLATITEYDLPVTDDFPALEYAPPSFSRCPLEPEMFEPTAYGVWCPKCVSEPGLAAELTPRMARLDPYYRSTRFLGDEPPCP